MISPGAFIFGVLVATSAVTAIVDRKIFPTKQEGNKAPYIQYRLVRDYLETSHGGRSGLSRPIYRLRLVTTDYTQLEALSLAVKTTLAEYRGTFKDFVVQNCALLACSDDDDENEPDPKFCVRLMDFEIWHKDGL